MKCEVILNTIDCEAPISAEGYSIRTRCYRCGQPACAGCSVIKVEHGKRIRVCNDCAGRYQ